MLSAALLALTLSGGGALQREWGPPPPVAPYGNDPLPSERVIHPMVFPLLGKSWTFRGGYNSPRGSHLHPGMDIAAPKMTPIVAPISGILGFKRQSFWIWGDDEWAVLGTHLNDDNPGRNDNAGTRDVMFAPDLVPGQRVEAGRFIGYVGDSGNATAPHLHLELFAPGNRSAGGRTRGNLRDPGPSLRAATRISSPKVAIPSLDDRPPAGQLRLQGCVRKVTPAEQGAPGTITLLLVAKQDASGRVTTTTRPRYLKLRVPTEATREVGGWKYLSRIPATTTLAAYVDARNPADNSVAIRLAAATLWR